MCVTPTSSTSTHKYTRVVRDQDGVEVKGMIGLVLVKKDTLRSVQNVWVVKEVGKCL